MTAPRLGPRQTHILTAITRHIAEHGYPPSVREIGELVGLTSTSSVHWHLKALESKGYLRRVGHRSRAVTVVQREAA